MLGEASLTHLLEWNCASSMSTKPHIFKNLTHTARSKDISAERFVVKKRKETENKKCATSYKCSSLPSPDTNVNWGEGLEDNNFCLSRD